MGVSPTSADLPPNPPGAGGPGEVGRQAALYRALVDSIDEGFCIVEMIFDGDQPRDYRFLEINRVFAEQAGLRDAKGKRMTELAPEHEAHWFAIYGRVAMTGESIRFVQHAHALADRWFDVYAFRVDEPAARHVAILFRDITSRVRSERAAKLLAEVNRDLLRITREEEFASILGTRIAGHFRVALCAFGELDESLRLVHLKNCWRALDVTFTAGQHSLDEFVTEQLWRDAQAGKTIVVNDVAADSRITNAEPLLRSHLASFIGIPLHRAGEWKYFLMLFRREPSEWPQEQINLAREIATRSWAHLERLRADSAVRASEERLRLIVENARDYAIFSIDLDRRVATWNIGAERLLGYREEEIVGRDAGLIFTPEDRERDAPGSEVRTALRDGRSADERWHQRKDGTRFWGSGVMTAIRDENGVVCGLLKVMRDETQAEATRQALAQSRENLLAALETTERARADAVAAGRAKDQFLATLSHELRTPLNPVLMLASEGAADSSLPESLRADFDLIRRSMEHEARLIDDMLDITRIAQGKLSLQSIDVDLHDSIRAALETVAGAAGERGIIPRVELNATSSHVIGDPARLRQIFTNLLSNAVKFSPNGGEVRVETTNPPDRHDIVTRVVDDGIGLTTDEIARVFVPFAQGSHAGSGGSALYGGLGLGLAIAEELTTRHGGRITAASEGPGRGATFELTLPLSPDPEREGHPLLASAESSRNGEIQRRILLVEDHAHTRAVLQRILRRHRHHVVAVGTRAQALEAAGREEFDVLVSDLGLPDGDGYELFGTLRSKQPGLQGIALSGFGMESDLRQSAAVGFSAHLVKPISVARLDAAIRQTRARAQSGSAANE